MTVHRTTEQDALPNSHPGAAIASARASKTISHSYYVALMDYGKDGFEALPVNPEFTMQNVVDEILKARNAELIHVKHIEGNYCEDVTEEVRALLSQVEHEIERDHRAARFDHAHDLRKHEVA